MGWCLCGVCAVWGIYMYMYVCDMCIHVCGVFGWVVCVDGRCVCVCVWWGVSICVWCVCGVWPMCVYVCGGRCVYVCGVWHVCVWCVCGVCVVCGLCVCMCVVCVVGGVCMCVVCGMHTPHTPPTYI